MQKRSVIAAIAASLALSVNADSIHLRNEMGNVTLSGEHHLIDPLRSLFEKIGFRKVDGLPDNKISCLIGAEEKPLTNSYEVYCIKNNTYQGGMFSFARKESIAFLPDVLTALVVSIEGKTTGEHSILAIPGLPCARAVCIPEKGCIPFTTGG